MDLVQNLENLIRKENLFKKGDGFVIGVSGGVDSVTLLYCLNRLKKAWKFKIYVAHLNHGLRKEAGIDENFVNELAKKYKLPFFTKKVKLPRANIEEAGREERYKFFREIQKETKATHIITAHNLNDNVETVLLNLVRGAGLAGLSGMKLKEREIVRPFLNFKRTEIEISARKNKLKWREDPTNRQLRFSRNRLRLKIIPELLKINKKADENILRSAKILGEAKKFFRFETKKFLKDNLKKEKGKQDLNLENFYPLDNFFKKEILKEVLRNISKNIGKIHLEDIVSLTKKSGTKELHLPSGLIILKEYDKLIFAPFKTVPPLEAKIPLLVDSKVEFQSFTISSEKKEKLEGPSKESVFIDSKKTGNLFVRTRKEGDKIYLSKYGTRKKLKELLIEKKIPRKVRNFYPIIVNDKNEIVWIPFIRQDERFRAGKQTKTILNLKAKHED